MFLTRRSEPNRLLPMPLRTVFMPRSGHSNQSSGRPEELGDRKDEVAHRVRRQPLQAVALAAGVGLLLGMAVGWIGGRFGKRNPAV